MFKYICKYVFCDWSDRGFCKRGGYNLDIGGVRGVVCINMSILRVGFFLLCLLVWYIKCFEYMYRMNE